VQEIFKNFDKSGNQTLDIHEFFNICASIDATVQQNETDEIFK